MKRRAPGEAEGDSARSQRSPTPSSREFAMSDRGRSPGPSGSAPPGSRTGSPRGSQSPRPPTGSRSASPSSGGKWPESMGHDPAKPAETTRRFDRVELPAEAFTLSKPGLFTERPKAPISGGQRIDLEINTYRVKRFAASKVHQYDVAIHPLPSRPGQLPQKLWNSEAFKACFPDPSVHKGFLFDGRKLAWSKTEIPTGELRVKVVLDQPEEKNTFYILLKKTTEINMAVLGAYIAGKTSASNAILEPMMFFDHLLRQYPSQRLLSIKRNFYDPRSPGRSIDNVIEVRKGLYWSARLADNLSTGGIGLSINADVANTCFFIGGQDMITVGINYLATQNRNLRGLNPNRLEKELCPVQTRGVWVQSEAFKQLKKLSKLRFRVKHAGRPAHLDKPLGIDGFTFDARFGPEGATAENTRFESDGKTISVRDYFRQKYNVNLRFPRLPLIRSGSKGNYPMELCVLEPNQRYPFKLNPQQTQQMIKIAVTRPRERRADIEKGVAALDIGNDAFLKSFQVEIEPRFSKTDGRVLQPPTLHFGQGKVEPGHTGRWDLRNRKFWKPNVAPLDSWAFVLVDDSVNLPALSNFARTFTNIYRGHGGKVNQDPELLRRPGNIANNPAEIVRWAHEHMLAKRGYPQMMVYVVEIRGSPHYERLKKSADCRFGVGSQVLNANSVKQASPQYCSNVALKINAKLGGITSRTMPPWNSPGKTYFPSSRPTVIVGADVSHPSPGSPFASMAAMTMSTDPDGVKYSAACQTNGRRQETFTKENVHGLFGQLIQTWKQGHPGQFPAHVIYFRDGLSNGEFAACLENELAEIKSWLRLNAANAPMPKFTVLCATKRHHVRMFPARGDRNGNALPGTMLEKEAVSPRLFDWYLTAHVAIQGTARPAHYHVLLNEMTEMTPGDLQKMIYEQCYTYARSTTPVSIHPAICYAHLAAARARAHENVAASEGPITGGKGHQAAMIGAAQGGSTSSQSGEVLPLLPLGGHAQPNTASSEEIRQRNFWRTTMWFV